jgi:DTW domain-containing protein YfiP
MDAPQYELVLGDFRVAVFNAQWTEAREIFTRNPDLERLLDIMQRGHF